MRINKRSHILYKSKRKLLGVGNWQPYMQKTDGDRGVESNDGLGKQNHKKKKRMQPYAIGWTKKILGAPGLILLSAMTELPFASAHSSSQIHSFLYF